MRNIKSIVIHHTAVTQPDMTKLLKSVSENHKERLHPTPNGFGNHISYHFIIGVDGKVVATRPIEEVGYHASNLSVNKTSIGIALSGNFDEYEPTELQYQALKKLIKSLRKQYQLLVLHVHNEFSSKSCPGTNFLIGKILDMLKYHSMWKEKLEKVPAKERGIQDPHAFIEHIKTLENDMDIYEEFVFFIALALGKK